MDSSNIDHVHPRLIEFFFMIMNLGDSAHSIIVVYVDFAKAFIEVCYKLLLSNISVFDIQGSLCSWLQTFVLSLS